jgi:hypothetical protein
MSERELSIREDRHEDGARFRARERPPAHWLWLSPLEERILQAVSAGEWAPLAAIVKAAVAPEPVGWPREEIAALVDNLVARNILEGDAARGYRLRGG